MKKNIIRYGIVLSSLVSPLLTFGAIGGGFTQTTGLIAAARELVNSLIVIVAGIGLLVFFWGLVKYIASAGNEEAAKKGKSIMVYGVIALFVMFSIWGIITFIGGEVGITPGDIMPAY